jgi:hypothetical protein
MIKRIENIFVVEYSVEQNSFHVCTVGEMIEANRRKLAQLISTDYIPVALATSYDEAIALSRVLRKQIDQQIESGHERKRVEMLKN